MCFLCCCAVALFPAVPFPVPGSAAVAAASFDSHVWKRCEICAAASVPVGIPLLFFEALLPLPLLLTLSTFTRRRVFKHRVWEMQGTGGRTQHTSLTNRVHVAAEPLAAHCNLTPCMGRLWCDLGAAPSSSSSSSWVMMVALPFI